ncbi:LuxR family transcriptional regulator [Rahnella sp. SAP-1]|uniref:LuxR family transcriptional regulator n=1 Tax=Rouxiella aceris TaxID=2703884 RepID=A0A848MIG7_9GAMM|nr:LuxR family transcriptional regulator [Rouxiella aceris]NMP28228.1 LuxR family transcriptional regulator [Rouxiella aceris]
MYFNNDLINNVVKNSLEKDLLSYGKISYTYAVMNKKNPSDFFALSNYPDEWIDIYIQNDYQYIDPVMITSLRNVLPFFWNEEIMSKASLKLTKVISIGRKYNIIGGYTFILHDNNHNLATLSILVDSIEDGGILKIIVDNKDKIQMILMTIHDMLISLYGEIEHNSTLKEKGLLSQRENEIFYWASMGKSYHEIAIILGITQSTVKFHMGNVVKKLGVLNAKQAIRLGTELQLIRPLDNC